MCRFFRLAALLSFFPFSGYASVLEVGPTFPIHSVKTAVGQARSGDTIRVHRSVYKEKNLIIDKPVFLLGVDMPVLDGELRYEVVSIKSDSVRMYGFDIRNSGVSSTVDYSGIKVYDARFVQLEENRILNCFFGIYFQYASACTAKGNFISSNAKAELLSGNGIHCWNCDSMRIEKNLVTGHRDGIYFEFVKNSAIESNRSWNNLRYGLHFMFSNDDVYKANVFVQNGAGVAVMFSKKVIMLNNVFRQNWGDAAYGILLKEISDGVIEGNEFERNTCGIFMEGASRVRLEKNRFTANGWAMKIQASCMENRITRNDFISNTFDVGTNGNLVLSDFTGNYWDHYTGYDLDRNGIGDIPFRPVSLFSVILERNPTAMVMFRSFLSTLMDQTEKVLPSITPVDLKDDRPLMKPVHA